MKRPYQISAMAILLFAVFIGQQAIRMRYYTYEGPGPGFLPLWLSIILGVLAATMFLQATFGRSEPMPQDFVAPRVGYIRLGAIIAAMVWAVALITPLGFRLTVLPFLVFLLMVLGRQKPAVTAAVALAGSFGVYYVFVDWLGVPLPVGMFGI